MTEPPPRIVVAKRPRRIRRPPKAAQAIPAVVARAHVEDASAEASKNADVAEELFRGMVRRLRADRGK